MTALPGPDWITVEQLAEQLRPDVAREVGERWVRDQMARGAIPSVRIGSKRYLPRAMHDSWIASLNTAPETPAADAWGRPPRARKSA